MATPSEPAPLIDPLDRAEALLAECLERAPDEREPALRQACSDHPDLAAELQRRAGALRQLGIAFEASTADDSFPGQLGDFRLIDRLGSGGMGVVYLAEQMSLGRKVALKLIRPEHLYFPRARERFRRETEAVAQLEHPGIVPIYTVGEQDGIPYYAMQFVPGGTLGDVLATLRDRAPESLSAADLWAAVAQLAGSEPDTTTRSGDTNWVDTCVRLARDVAQTLHHAHQRGIVHRDVKPSNLALTPDGRVLLLDFGLTSSLGEERMTRTGAALGTPAYMSPEQVRGAHEVDARTDVYALGVTLYEMLALRTPYRGDGSISTTELVLAGRPPPLRPRNPRVSTELETVCLVAMDPDPARRYATAEALARDLGNILEKRPIAARAPGTALKVRRWAQRNPASTAALVLGVLLVVGIPISLLIQESAYAEEIQTRLISEREARAVAQAAEARALTAADEAAAERDNAQAEAALSAAVTEYLVGLFELADPNVTGGDTITARDLLDRGRDRIDEQLADQPATRAHLLSAMGRSYRGLGLYDESVPLLEDALAVARELAAGQAVERRALVRSLGALALTEYLRANDARAEALYLEQLSLLEDLPDVTPADLAVTRSRLGAIAAEQERWDEGEQLLRDSLPVLRSDPTVDPADTSFALHALGTAIFNRAQRGKSNQPQVDFAEAEHLLVEALAHLDASDDRPTTKRAGILSMLGLAVKAQARLAEAEEHYRAALEINRQLLGSASQEVATLKANLAGLREAQGDLAEAAELLADSAETFERLLSTEHPNVALVRGNLAGVLFRSGRFDEAEAAYLTAIPLQRQAFGEQHVFVAYSESNLGTCLSRRGAHDEAGPHFDQAVKLLEGWYGAERPEVSYALLAQGESLLAADRPAEALGVLERAAELTRGDPGHRQQHAEAGRLLEHAHERLGDA